MCVPDQAQGRSPSLEGRQRPCLLPHGGDPQPGAGPPRGLPRLSLPASPSLCADLASRNLFLATELQNPSPAALPASFPPPLRAGAPRGSPPQRAPHLLTPFCFLPTLSQRHCPRFPLFPQMRTKQKAPSPLPCPHPPRLASPSCPGRPGISMPLPESTHLRTD